MGQTKEYGDRILALLDNYEKELGLLRAEHSTAGDVLLSYVGMNKEKKSPMHRKLYSDVEIEVTGLTKELQAESDPEQAERVVRILLGAAPYERTAQDDTVRLMNAAIEGLAESVIPFLQADVCAELGEFYGKKYNPREMLPKQKTVYLALKKSNSKKESLFEKLFKKGGK